ncbi:hypothetical protein FB451DRAFT_1552896 [Mycena latifolia]|nr:hypothetical protein FB451DRAFT_1552896 [Mycena latifolia]
MESGDSPFLPPELEREIFEIAADLYPETIHTPSLLLVAKRVHEWMSRIRYHTVTSVEYAPACPFRILRNAIHSNSKPADFFHDRVRHLFVETAMDADEMPRILDGCSGIQTLALANCVGPSILPSLAAMQLRRLSIDLMELFKGIDSLDLSHPAFIFVTHFESVDHHWRSNDFPWSKFALFPALTHLASWQLTRKASVVELLSKCPKLEVLIRMSHPDYSRHDLLSVDDERFVCLSMSYNRYTTTNWLAGTKGGMDFWVLAEIFVAKKQRGEIQPRSRCWITTGDGI